VKQVAGALIEILSDADRAAVMGAAGRRHVHETYRKDVTLKRIEAALQKAVVRS
jgi:glycosyltransferase involved in cell wall biosynthesis